MNKVLAFDNCLRVTGQRSYYAALVADALIDDHEVVLGLPVQFSSNRKSSLYQTGHSVSTFTLSVKTLTRKGKAINCLF